MKTLAALLVFLPLLQAAPTAPAGPAVVVVPISGEIDLRNVALVERAVKEIQARKPALVLFEIDSPGGRIDYMLTMGEAMMSLAPIPTAAWVRPLPGSGVTGGAWSAGAFLAMSCKRLYMFPGTVIGAATPVSQSEEGVKPVEEKYVSAFREKFRARAEQNGYPPNLAVAMVDKDLEVFEVTVDGKKLYLTMGEIEKFRNDGKRFDIPSVPYDSKDKVLTMTDRQVVEAGMGKIAKTREEIWSDHALAAPTETLIGPSWSEKLVGFLTSPFVAMLLLVVGVVGIWIELKTPGFGVPGVLGIAAIGLLLFGHHLAGLAQATDIVLFVLGVVLVMVELFFFPGVGAFAIAGVLCIVGGLILSFQGFTIPDVQGAPWEVDILFSSIGRVLSSLAIAAVGFLAILRFLPRVPMANRLVLQTAIAGAAPVAAGNELLAGKKGHATTPLHPGGKVELDGQIVDVVAEGEFVAQGEPVEVLRVEGMRVVVGRTKR